LTEKELFETYNKDIYKTSFFMLHNKSDAEDVCQEVFMTVFRHDWRKVEHLKAWLMRVTVNHCLNHLKKNNRLKHKATKLQDQAVPLSAKAADTIVEEREGFMDCVELLSRLPGKIRAVVSLRFISDYSLNEIADILSIPVGTVKSRLNRGLKLMKLFVQTNEKEDKDGAAYGQDRTKVFPAFKR
jgi:RNA polymerase sigma factor (sigma-70 family)